MEEVAGDGGGDLGMEACAGQDGGVDLCESRSNDSCEIKEVAATGCAKITLFRDIVVEQVACENTC
jgi:hypothetical protein